MIGSNSNHFIKPKDLTKKKDKSLNVVLHKFRLLICNANSNTLFCFFEGKEDSSYYIKYVLEYFENMEPIVCNGKKNVRKAYKKFKELSEYDKYKKAYFTDRDYDRINTLPEIFETSTYSIENLYATKTCFEKILKNLFHLTRSEVDYEKCLNLFIAKKREFNNSILLFNVWYYTKKQLGNCEVKLSNNFPSRLFTWNFDKNFISNYCIEDIEEIYLKEDKVDREALEKSKEYFKGKDLNLLLRGKYQIQFMRKILRFLIIDSENKKEFLEKTSFNFQENMLIALLSPYADKAEGLDEYLSRL